MRSCSVSYEHGSPQDAVESIPGTATARHQVKAKGEGVRIFIEQHAIQSAFGRADEKDEGESRATASNVRSLPPSAGDGRAALSHGDTSDVTLLRLLQWYADRLTRGWQSVSSNRRLDCICWKGRSFVRACIIRTFRGPTGQPGFILTGARAETSALAAYSAKRDQQPANNEEIVGWHCVEPGVYVETVQSAAVDTPLDSSTPRT
ncbi:MAG: hypothetical protein ACOC0P_01310 [Planctomycetota bacterium]